MAPYSIIIHKYKETTLKYNTMDNYSSYIQLHLNINNIIMHVCAGVRACTHTHTHARAHMHTHTPTPSAIHYSVSVTYSWPYSVHTDRWMLWWKLRRLFGFHGSTRKHLNRSWLQALCFSKTPLLIPNILKLHVLKIEIWIFEMEWCTTYWCWDEKRLTENNGGSKLLDFCERMWGSVCTFCDVP